MDLRLSIFTEGISKKSLRAEVVFNGVIGGWREKQNRERE